MTLKFVYQGRNALVECELNDTVKLYDVPTDYSNDGFYAAVWRKSDIEPRPACAGDETRLLAEVSAQPHGDGVAIGGALSEGVDVYAEN